MAEIDALQIGWFPTVTRRWYRRLLFPLIADPLQRQRLKLAWYGWGYVGLLRLALPWRERLRMLRAFLRIDWHVLHGHLPSEMVILCAALVARPARPNEVILEAGCWNGGGSAKLSLLARYFGYRLVVYDSFEGVEQLSPADAAREWAIFQGQYAASEAKVRIAIALYGALEVCTLVKGWFADTLAQGVGAPVRLAYIDCDLAKGTREALTGIVPALAADAAVLTQDFHIDPVRQQLADPAMWRALGRTTPPVIVPRGEFLAEICL